MNKRNRKTKRTRTSKPFKIVVPKTITELLLQTLEKKPLKARNCIYKFYFVLNYLLYKEVNLNIEKKEKFFPINNEHLHTMLDCCPDQFINYLRDCGFIVDDGLYRKGEKCYHYRLNPAYRYDCCTVLLKPGNVYFERKRKYHERKRQHEHAYRMCKHLKQMKKRFLDMEFDYDKAMRLLSTFPNGKKKIQYLMQIEGIADKRTRFFKRNKTNNRLDTSLTNLKKEFRDCIKGDFMQSDNKNSQPFLFNQLLRHVLGLGNATPDAFFKRENDLFEVNSIILDNSSSIFLPTGHKSQSLSILSTVFTKYKPHETFGRRKIREVIKIHQKWVKTHGNCKVNEELEKFNEWVNSGLLYDKFCDWFNTHSTSSRKKLTRDDVKKIFFCIFFSRNRVCNKKNGNEFVPFQKLKKQFARVFPMIAEMIVALKAATQSQARAKDEKKIKNNDHSLLSVYLQKVESYVFIDHLARVLVAEGIVPDTVHDSVMVKREHEQRTIEIADEVFRMHFGIAPTLEISYLGTADTQAEANPVQPAENATGGLKTNRTTWIRRGSYEHPETSVPQLAVPQLAEPMPSGSGSGMDRIQETPGVVLQSYPNDGLANAG